MSADLLFVCKRPQLSAELFLYNICVAVIVGKSLSCQQISAYLFFCQQMLGDLFLSAHVG
jgi:hypothetical protein